MVLAPNFSKVCDYVFLDMSSTTDIDLPDQDEADQLALEQ